MPSPPAHNRNCQKVRTPPSKQHALICRAMPASRHYQPVFILGSTGVGKTELALNIAKQLPKSQDTSVKATCLDMPNNACLKARPWKLNRSGRDRETLSLATADSNAQVAPDSRVEKQRYETELLRMIPGRLMNWWLCMLLAKSPRPQPKVPKSLDTSIKATCLDIPSNACLKARPWKLNRSGRDRETQSLATADANVQVAPDSRVEKQRYEAELLRVIPGRPVNWWLCMLLAKSPRRPKVPKSQDTSAKATCLDMPNNACLKARPWKLNRSGRDRETLSLATADANVQVAPDSRVEKQRYETELLRVIPGRPVNWWLCMLLAKSPRRPKVPKSLDTSIKATCLDMPNNAC